MKIVVLDGYTLNSGDLSWSGLKEWGDVTVYDRTPAEKILKRSENAEVPFTNKAPLGEEVFRKLVGKTIGITGFGMIGQIVGDVTTALGMNILAAKKQQTDLLHRNNFQWSGPVPRNGPVYTRSTTNSATRESNDKNLLTCTSKQRRF